MSSRSTRWLVVCLLVAATVVGTALALSINLATAVDRWPAALDTIRQHPFWWSAGLTIASGALGVAVWMLTSRAGTGRRSSVFDMGASLLE